MAAVSGLRSPSGPGTAFRTIPGTVLRRAQTVCRALRALTRAGRVRKVSSARGFGPARAPALMAPRSLASRAGRPRRAGEDDRAAAPSPRPPPPRPLSQRLPSAPGTPSDPPERAGSPRRPLAPGEASNCAVSATRPAAPRPRPSGSRPAAHRPTNLRKRTRPGCRSHGEREPASRAAAERAPRGSRGHPSAARTLLGEALQQRGAATPLTGSAHTLTAFRPLRCCLMKAHINMGSPPSATTTITFWPSASRTSVLLPRCGERTAWTSASGGLPAPGRTSACRAAGSDCPTGNRLSVRPRSPSLIAVDYRQIRSKHQIMGEVSRSRSGPPGRPRSGPPPRG